MAGEQPQRILIVEDNDTFRQTVRDLLRDAGYEVRAARNLSKATKRLSKQTFDLVLTDLSLGDATGLDVVQIANTQHPTTKIIVMSAAAEISDEAVRAGIARFLPKPFGMKTLLAAISEMLDEPAATASKTTLSAESESTPKHP